LSGTGTLNSGLTQEYMVGLDFLKSKENLIFLGSVGTGKTHLATAIALTACQQDSYASMELKYQQGTISKNALLDAEDDLREAEEKVRTSANDLFSSYNTYCWAVQHGVLN